MATNPTPSQLVDEAEDEENSESSDYVETEPILAYSRMKNDIIAILEKDSVSCIRADHKVFKKVALV